MNKVIDRLPALVDEELEASNALHPSFHSLHEGYAVLLEEVEEAGEELDKIRDSMSYLWNVVRNDRADLAVTWSETIEEYAVHLAAEAIQVAAMARKFRGGQTIDPAPGTAQAAAEWPTGGPTE